MGAAITNTIADKATPCNATVFVTQKQCKNNDDTNQPTTTVPKADGTTVKKHLRKRDINNQVIIKTTILARKTKVKHNKLATQLEKGTKND